MTRPFMQPVAIAACMLLTGISTSHAQDAFPVTITHGLGETMIPAKPQRVATLGWIVTDAVIALGVDPVGVPAQDWGGDENRLLPWQTEALAARDATLPDTYDANAIPFEAILALDPDLILAPYSGLTDEEYARLSQIAPTVGWLEPGWNGNWQDVTRVAGQALGRTQEADALVSGTLAMLEETRTSHPAWAATSFVFATAEPGSGSLGVYLPTDARARFVAELGLQLAPGAAALDGDSFYVDVSFEQLDTVDADILLLWQDGREQVDTLISHPLFARFRPVQEERLIAITDRSTVMAVSAPSPLAIPFAIGMLVPPLEAALD